MADVNPNAMYVIGDRNTGVLFVRLNPLRVSILSREEIENSGGKSNFDESFGRIATQIQAFIIQNDKRAVPANFPAVSQALGGLVQTGTTISDAAFCFITELQTEAWKATRIPWPDVEDSLDNLASDAAAAPSTAYKASATVADKKSDASKPAS